MADYPYLIETSTAYNMAKASTDALVRTIASSLARYNILVNSIHPGWIDTRGERQFTSSTEMQKVLSIYLATRVCCTCKISSTHVY